MLINYYQETNHENIPTYLDLVKNHYDEISIFAKLGYEFNPDINSYVMTVKSGQLKIYVASFETSTLGYVTFIIYEHPHCKGLMTAMMDLFYLEPKYRGIGAGKDLLIFAEKELKKIGIKIVVTAMTSEYDFTPLMHKLNYRLMDKLFIKEL